MTNILARSTEELLAKKYNLKVRKIQLRKHDRRMIAMDKPTIHASEYNIIERTLNSIDHLMTA